MMIVGIIVAVGTLVGGIRVAVGTGMVGLDCGVLVISVAVKELVGVTDGVAVALGAVVLVNDAVWVGSTVAGTNVTVGVAIVVSADSIT